MNEIFTTPEAFKNGEKYTSTPETQTKASEMNLNIVYPENKHPETYGFL